MAPRPGSEKAEAESPDAPSTRRGRKRKASRHLILSQANSVSLGRGKADTAGRRDRYHVARRRLVGGSDHPSSGRALSWDVASQHACGCVLETCPAGGRPGSGSGRRRGSRRACETIQPGGLRLSSRTVVMVTVTVQLLQLKLRLPTMGRSLQHLWRLVQAGDEPCSPRSFSSFR